MSESGLNQLKDSGAISISGKVMFAAVIILFITIVFVLFLHIYAKWFWGSRSSHPQPSSRSSNPRRLAFAPARDSALAPRRGLELSLMRSLPVVIFGPGEFKDGLECAVCLCEVADGEKVRLLPKCNHGFHLDCIDMWFQSHSTCPLCRNPVASEPPPAPASSEPESRIPDLSAAEEHSSESSNYPTNILFWGDQNQVSTGRSSGSEDGTPSSSSSSPVSRAEGNAAVAMDIPRQPAESLPSPSSPAVRFQEEEPPKSPRSTRLRSLKRLLSREKRVVPCGNNAGDIEQGMGGG